MNPPNERTPAPTGVQNRNTNRQEGEPAVSTMADQIQNREGMPTLNMTHIPGFVDDSRPTACGVYAWCENSHESPHRDDQLTHNAYLPFGRFEEGRSRFVRVYYHQEDGLSFSIDVPSDWSIASKLIDAEIDDELLVLTRARAVMKAFVASFLPVAQEVE